MLSKEVCKHCCRKRKHNWNDGLERVWDFRFGGSVQCPKVPYEDKLILDWILVRGVPPMHCDYKFEHAVAGVMADVE